MNKFLAIGLLTITSHLRAEEYYIYDQTTQNNIQSSATVVIMPNANINIVEQVQQIDNNTHSKGKYVEYPPRMNGDDYPVGTTRIIRSR